MGAVTSTAYSTVVYNPPGSLAGIKCNILVLVDSAGLYITNT